MNGNASTGVLSALAPIVHGATKTATDPGKLRRQLCGRAIARAYLTQHWTAEELWSVAKHIGLTRADVRAGARMTNAQVQAAHEALWTDEKLSDPSEMVTT